MSDWVSWALIVWALVSGGLSLLVLMALISNYIPWPGADERRNRASDRRAGALNAREQRLAARENEVAQRAEQAHRIIVAADERDRRAEARDVAATLRDAAATREELLRPPDEGTLVARGAGALDRTDAQADRAASAKDRHQLADLSSPSDAGDKGLVHARAIT